ncbi:unnamed protein product [Rhizopus stolonifer]
MAVVVDGITFPLQKRHGILFQGEAPVATRNYHYKILNINQESIIPEPFVRNPILENTTNEFFNRSSNTYNVTKLPQILSPLPAIHRIKSDLHLINQIPTINLWGNATAIDYMNNNQLKNINIKLNLTYFGLKDIQEFEDVKVNVAGRGTRNFEKLSYNIKIKKKDLFGFKKLKLRALVTDTTFMREQICYSVIKSLGMPSSDFSYVRLFLNNEPFGLFGVIETFQDPWPADEFSNGDKNYSSGYLYQGHVRTAKNSPVQRLSDLSYYENLTDYSLGEYSIKAGPSRTKVEGYSILQKFTKFVHEASNTTSESEWEKYLDTQSFLRGMIAENILSFSDGYMTTANNFYLYSSPAKDGQLIYIPSDMDISLGIAIFELDLMHTGNYTEFPGLTFRPLTKKFFSYEYFSTPYQELLLKVTKELFNPTVLNPYIANIKAMISRDVDWDLTLPRAGKPEYSKLQATIDNASVFFPPGILPAFGTQGAEVFTEYINTKSSAILNFYNQTSI